MSHLALSYSATPLCFSPSNIHNSNSITNFSCNSFTPFRHKPVSLCKTRHIVGYFRNNPNVLHKYALKCKEGNDDGYSFTAEDETVFFNLNDDDDEEIEDTGSPWEGAVIYKRNASILHLEYCTTLERLGLGFLSTDVSKNKASVMGLRVTKAVKDYPNGTPVQISVDVTRKRKKLRLDGIIKTVITLTCYRCGMPSAETIFNEFSLLLTEEPPIDEPDTINLVVILGKDKISTRRKSGEDDDDEDALIDLDDQLHFPPEEKQIDISKNIRDRVHLKITLNSVCDSACKGICLNCGQNFNTGNCSCSKEEIKEESFGPLSNLREQMRLKNLR